MKRVGRGVGFNPNVHCDGFSSVAVEVSAGKCDGVVADLREFQGALTRQVSQTVPVTYSSDERVGQVRSCSIIILTTRWVTMTEVEQ